MRVLITNTVNILGELRQVPQKPAFRAGGQTPGQESAWVRTAGGHPELHSETISNREIIFWGMYSARALHSVHVCAVPAPSARQCSKSWVNG